MEPMFLDNVLALLMWAAGVCGVVAFLVFIVEPFFESWIEKHFPDPEDSTNQYVNNQKTCYQCENEAGHLFEDGRCWRCTRVDPDDVRG